MVLYAILSIEKENKTMTNTEKITVKTDWLVAGLEARRVSIRGSTYRQALTYITILKNSNCKDTLIKPILY